MRSSVIIYCLHQKVKILIKELITLNTYSSHHYYHQLQHVQIYINIANYIEFTEKVVNNNKIFHILCENRL